MEYVNTYTQSAMSELCEIMISEIKLHNLRICFAIDR